VVVDTRKGLSLKSQLASIESDAYPSCMCASAVPLKKLLIGYMPNLVTESGHTPG